MRALLLLLTTALPAQNVPINGYQTNFFDFGIAQSIHGFTPRGNLWILSTDRNFFQFGVGDDDYMAWYAAGNPWRRCRVRAVRAAAWGPTHTLPQAVGVVYSAEGWGNDYPTQTPAPMPGLPGWYDFGPGRSLDGATSNIGMGVIRHYGLVCGGYLHPMRNVCHFQWFYIELEFS